VPQPSAFLPDTAASWVVGGLATDYCVVNTVLEGLEAGFSFDVIADGILGVDAQPGDSDRAIERMKAVGARFV
jgi:nicotinamidase/pyrazinamidase